MLDRAHLFNTVLAAILVTSAAAACTKTEGPSGTTSSSTAMGSAMPTPSASATMAAPSAMTADTMTDAAPAMSATATTSATTANSAKPATSGSAATADAAPACGTKPLPDCPLQAWMKANTNPAIASGDLPALATALDKAASFAPAGYANWASIAKDGAKAAKANDMTAAKASCRTCHDQYKEKYKKEMRARKI